MILSEESDDEHHNCNEDKADGVLSFKESFSSIGNFITNVLQELTLFIGEDAFSWTTTKSDVTDDINAFDCDDLEDCPEDAEQAADADDDDLSWVAQNTVAGAARDQEVLKPVVDSKHKNNMNLLNNKIQ